MNFLDMAKIGVKKGLFFADRNSPTILTILGASGVFTTAGLAVRATPEALDEIDKAKFAKEREFFESVDGVLNFDERDAARHLTPFETFKAVWRCYVPTAAVALVTVGCIVGANSINLRRNAALAGLYSITREAFEKYQEKVVEEIGKNKEEKVRERVAQETLDKHPVDNRHVLSTGRGDVLFFDPWSGRYFKSDPETVRRIINDFNRRVNTDSYRSLNCFYDDLGLEHIRSGDDVGWIADRGLMDVPFITKLTPDERPCIVLDFRNGPVMLTWPRD